MKGILVIAVLATAASIPVSGQPSKNSIAPELTLISRARVSAIYDIEAVPPYAYALERGILRVLDVHNPAATREVGSLELERPRVRMALRYPYLYLTGFRQPLGVVDISRPTRPRWVAEFPDLGVPEGDGFELVGEVAYLIRREGDLGENNALFFDVLDVGTNPARPHRLGSIDLGVRVTGEFGGFGGIAWAEGRAFVLVSRATGIASRSQILVVNARVPNKPQVERTMLLSEGKHYSDIDVRGDLLFLLQSGRWHQKENGLAVYRMRAEGDPELFGQALSSELSIPIDLIAHEDVVYATFKVGSILATFDVSNPRDPKLIHTYTQRELWSAGLGMALVNNRLYVTGDNGPATIFDVSEPRAPRLLGRYEFEGGWVNDVVKEGKLAILISLSDLLFYDVYDVSNPRAPRRLGRHKGVPSYEPDYWQWNVVAAASGSHVFVAYETIPAQMLEVSNPARPIVLGEFKPRGLVHAIALTPTHAFLGYRDPAEGKIPRIMEPSSLTGRGGIEVVDLRNPRSPRAGAALGLDQAVTSLALGGGRLLAAHPDNSLTIIDIRDPNSPTVMGHLASSGSPGAGPPARTPRAALSADGRLAYVVRGDINPGEEPFGRGHGTLILVDLQDATKPRVSGQLRFESSGGVELPIMVRGNHAAILAGNAGEMLVVDASDPERPMVKSKHAFPSGVFTTGFALDENHAYVSAAEDGLMIYRLPPALH